MDVLGGLISGQCRCRADIPKAVRAPLTSNYSYKSVHDERQVGSFAPPNTWGSQLLFGRELMINVYPSAKHQIVVKSCCIIFKPSHLRNPRHCRHYWMRSLKQLARETVKIGCPCSLCFGPGLPVDRRGKPHGQPNRCII